MQVLVNSETPEEEAFDAPTPVANRGEALVVAVRQLVEDLFQKLGEVGPIFLLQLGAEGLLERQSRRTA